MSLNGCLRSYTQVKLANDSKQQSCLAKLGLNIKSNIIQLHGSVS